MPKQFPETPGERRCISCDQRLVTEAEPALRQGPPAPPVPVKYVCPDDHERWLYNPESHEWRQMY